MSTTLEAAIAPTPSTSMPGPSTPVELADAYLRSARTGDADRGRAASDALARLDEEALRDGLTDDAARLAFWIDVYNGAAARERDVRLDSWRGRLRFLGRDVVRVAGERLSLDRIEHGILRRGRWRFGAGYLRSPRRTPFERRHEVERLDPRIHFALNCAAASCPPIAAYAPGRIDEQLDLATRSFLAASVSMREDVARVSPIFLWYHGDFRARGGVRAFLAAHGVDIGPRKLRFGSWDWTPAPGRWADD